MYIDNYIDHLLNVAVAYTARKAGKKVKDLQAQKTKAKTTAQKNNIQKQITAAQSTQKSLASQIATATTKKTNLQKHDQSSKKGTDQGFQP